MTLAAISYHVKPGHEDDIAEIFSPRNFKRASSPILRDEAGAKVGKIIGTGLFIAGDTMVRVIQYEGKLADVARHMAGQTGVREAEQRLAQYLAVARDTTTAEGFLGYFRNSTMRCPVHHVVDDRPLAQLVALRDTVRPAVADELVGLLAAGRLRITPERLDGGASRLLAAAVFVQGTTLVRALQYEGEVDDLARTFALDGGPERERALMPYLASPRAAGGPDDVIAGFHATGMRCISLLSVASLLAGRAPGRP